MGTAKKHANSAEEHDIVLRALTLPVGNHGIEILQVHACALYLLVATCTLTFPGTIEQLLSQKN